MGHARRQLRPDETESQATPPDSAHPQPRCDASTAYGITTTFTGLQARTPPHAPFTAHAGTTHRITVHTSVTERSGLPLDAEPRRARRNAA